MKLNPNQILHRIPTTTTTTTTTATVAVTPQMCKWWIWTWMNPMNPTWMRSTSTQWPNSTNKPSSTASRSNCRTCMRKTSVKNSCSQYSWCSNAYPTSWTSTSSKFLSICFSLFSSTQSWLLVNSSTYSLRPLRHAWTKATMTTNPFYRKSYWGPSLSTSKILTLNKPKTCKRFRRTNSISTSFSSVTIGFCRSCNWFHTQTSGCWFKY